VGFLQFERKGQTVEVGLGLRPDLTGRKLGLGYMLAGLEFARRHFSPPASDGGRPSCTTPTAEIIPSCR
jgi:ribosomal-protein-alanine N-acetyltransferase